MKRPQNLSVPGSSSGGGLDRSPLGSPNRNVKLSPKPEKSKLLLSAAPNNSKKSEPLQNSPRKENNPSLSLKLGGSNFLKPQTRDTLLFSDDEIDDTEDNSVPIKIVSNDTAKDLSGVRSILKTSPRKSPPEQKVNLRAAMMARDEKRIQFNIEDDHPVNLVVTSEVSFLIFEHSTYLCDFHVANIFVISERIRISSTCR